MVKLESLLLVLLLTTWGPPDRPDSQRPAKASPPAVLDAEQDSSPAPGGHCSRQLTPQSLRPELLPHHHVTCVLPRWLRAWLPSGRCTVGYSIDGGASGRCVGCGRGKGVGGDIAMAARSLTITTGSSRGWGIRVAKADLVDAGGVNVDGSGFRGGRQAAASTSKSTSSGDGRPYGRSTVETGNGGAGAASVGPGGTGGIVCSDSCPLARNGICEDGSNIVKLGRDGGVQVACDFGTDCTDCGPYKGVVSTWGSELGYKGPIDFLRRQGVKVFARRITFEPRFLFAYTDPKEDLDVSEQVERAGCMELGIVQVFRQVLTDRCAPFKAQTTHGSQQAPLVVDVGANFGYFAVYAAMLGCRVIAVEPVPRFLAFLHWNLAANGLQVVTRQGGVGSAAAARDAEVARSILAASGANGGVDSGGAGAVVVVERVVSLVSGINVTMAAPRKGVWGTASVAGMANNIDQDLELIAVGSVRLDEVVGSQQVALLKVDVEGYEPLVFHSGERLLEEGRVENIVLEYSPGMPETLERFFPAAGNKAPVVPEDPPKMLLDILGKGFSIVQLPDNFAKSGYSPQLQDPIPELQEVTPQSVMYDLIDVAWFRNLSAPGATCPWPQELRLANTVSWADGCMKAPEDSHPKGLRVTLSYNTNLWASRNRSSFTISGPVGLFAPEQDETKTWWSQRYPDLGVGNRACAYLPPGHLLRSRCRCSKPDVCGREEEALLRALAEGRLPRPPATSSS